MADMSDILDKIKSMIRTFSYVAASVLFATALFISIFQPQVSLDVTLLWQILGTTFICTLGNLIYPCREISARKIAILRVINYLYINVVIFGCAYYFNWFELNNWKMIVYMFVCITVIFVMVSWLAWHEDKKISDLLNHSLEEYREREKGE